VSLVVVVDPVDLFADFDGEAVVGVGGVIAVDVDVAVMVPKVSTASAMRSSETARSSDNSSARFPPRSGAPIWLSANRCSQNA
jgi:hypothetical protein